MPLVVITVQNVPEHTHGVLTRWTQKIGPTVYIGHMTTRVRQYLWNELTQIVDNGLLTMVYPDHNEQGYSINTHGANRYEPIDLDGLTLMARPPTLITDT